MCRERFFRQRVETSKWGPKSSVKWDPRLFWGYLLSYTGLFFTSHLYSWLLITLLNSAKLRLLENISITCARPKVIVKCYLNQHRTITDWQENHLKFGFGGPERVCKCDKIGHCNCHTQQCHLGFFTYCLFLSPFFGALVFLHCIMSQIAPVIPTV